MYFCGMKKAHRFFEVHAEIRAVADYFIPVNVLWPNHWGRLESLNRALTADPENAVYYRLLSRMYIRKP